MQRDLTTSSAPRRLQSDVVLVGLAATGSSSVTVTPLSWIPPRCASATTGLLFRGSSPAAGQGPAKALEDETAHYYLSPNLRVLDAQGWHEFLREANQPHSEFAIESVKNMDGAQVAIVKFTERPTSRILPTPEGAQTSGKFWIDVASGGRSANRTHR